MSSSPIAVALICNRPDAGEDAGATALIRMPVGLLTLEIHLPYAQSLKNKRAVLRKIRDRLRSRFNVATAELDHQDVWQHSVVGVVSISSSAERVEELLREVLRESEKILGEDVAHYEIELL